MGVDWSESQLLGESTGRRVSCYGSQLAGDSAARGVNWSESQQLGQLIGESAGRGVSWLVAKFFF
jgi:hypothetical protein